MWFKLNNPDEVISPSLLFYKDRIENNIRGMISIAGDADRLIPHVKTHKSGEIVKMQLEQGISKFKCATIAEAEMLADAGAKWILLAYQMVGPNITRLSALREKFQDVSFASLVDNEKSTDDLNKLGIASDVIFNVYIDVNNGMNRSGHVTDVTLLSLYRYISGLSNVSFGGVHVYDGHLRHPEFSDRKLAVDEAFETVLPLFDLIKNHTGNAPMIIAGGSPSFTVHAMRPDVYLSPGTNVLWDWGYGDRFDSQPFEHAALVLTRVVSKPTAGIVTIDLGHKAIAPESPIENRFKLLNLPSYTLMGQSEEHGVLQVTQDVWDATEIGDVLYALPYHVCPTVALHDFASVIEDGAVTDEWKIVARNRRLTI
ncbi:MULTISPECIES: D-TA family PLP-dependent enzyme [Dyadobacter]|uniref:D-TA family PLP-dependent enzyme n=1 Tax=Dyadobacter chenhuakuii TaxID=2909339 RepID=A0ABY4XPQ0_9BACT|nr:MULTISPECIES: D-TA family PLP-dependent enzyme [Dyadobacter]MCF2493347.1 D-TA family PLP-dependent enzyme [Dyadobacter chenhuakuii]MCF2517268.1 D-TA family PLP-dependent enzyme [Dyadobacter sp. CY351]USJ32375.1 D-TA family PLP-dependent enzyme [Dyadobacter chenhuakuii]